MFQVSNTPEGYVVQVLICGTWAPLRNFGERQSDAKEFCYKDCPKLSQSSIWLLAKNYDMNVKYIRINEKLFKNKCDEQEKRNSIRILKKSKPW